jgi:hypothetical protein
MKRNPSETVPKFKKSETPRKSDFTVLRSNYPKTLTVDSSVTER